MIFILDSALAIGLVPVQLANWKVRAAVVNTDRFVLGGPSATYINESLLSTLDFQETQTYTEQEWQTNPLHKDLLSLSKLEASLAAFLEAGYQNVQKKTNDLYHFAS